MYKSIIVSAAVPLMLMPATGANAAGPTSVVHNYTKSMSYPAGLDICGRPDEAHTDRYTVKTEQVHFRRAADGSFNYHDVTVATYVSDYDDPTISDLHGRLTEVNRFTLTPGEVFTGSTTFHDFFGDVRIHVKLHITEVKGELVASREIVKVVCARSA